MLYAGCASIDVTPPLGVPIQGASVANVAESVRDPLEANAICLIQDDVRLLLISVDVVGLHPDVAAEARQRLSTACDIPAEAIIIACTHTHNGPVVLWTNYTKPVDTAFRDQLLDALVTLACQAVKQLAPARLRWGQGSARIGYNRRCCWREGTHSMHGDTTRDDFTGLEGPDDPTHTALFLETPDGKLQAILHHNTSHPTCFYGQPFFSADFPGAARAYLREVYGELPVLFFNGAFGDISIGNMMSPGPNGGAPAMLRAAHAVAGETLRLYHDAPLAADELRFAHCHETIDLALRQPDAEHLAWARDQLARHAAGESVTSWELLRAHGATWLVDDLGGRPNDTLRLHAWRIGNLAFFSQPLELFCQFGLDIKRRSPFAATCVVGVADGYHGYCPTVYGILGGGYSGEAIWWTRFTQEAGYRLVDRAADMLLQLNYG